MEVDIYKSGKYLDSNPDWHAADAPYKARWINEILYRNLVDPTSIVEIGCGSGDILVNLENYFPQAMLTGYDISPQACSISSSKETDHLSFYEADYLAEPIVPTDLLMAIDVFEHVEDYMSFVRAMKPRANWKLFHIPLDLSVQGLLRGQPLMHAREVVGHLHYFYKETALATLKDCGYEIIDWNYTFGTEALPGRSLRTKMFNLPRRALRLLGEDMAVRITGGASMMVLAR